MTPFDCEVDIDRLVGTSHLTRPPGTFHECDVWEKIRSFPFGSVPMGDDLKSRTGSVCGRDAVLFCDPDDIGEITEMRRYVFTKWDPIATSDMEALAFLF